MDDYEDDGRLEIFVLDAWEGELRYDRRIHFNDKDTDHGHIITLYSFVLYIYASDMSPRGLDKQLLAGRSSSYINIGIGYP